MNILNKQQCPVFSIVVDDSAAVDVTTLACVEGQHTPRVGDLIDYADSGKWEVTRVVWTLKQYKPYGATVYVKKYGG